MARHDECSVCHTQNVRAMGSLVTIPSLGIYDVGANCCLDVSLSGYVTVAPREPMKKTLALKLLALGVR